MKVELQNIFTIDLSKRKTQRINHKALNRFINTFNVGKMILLISLKIDILTEW